MKKESDASEALNEFIWSVGVPKELISDGAQAGTQGEFGKVIKEYWIRQRITEPHSPWQNRAESTIHEIKHGIQRATTQAHSPKRL
jgi:ribosomal protein L31E